MAGKQVAGSQRSGLRADVSSGLRNHSASGQRVTLRDEIRKRPLRITMSPMNRTGYSKRMVLQILSLLVTKRPRTKKGNIMIFILLISIAMPVISGCISVDLAGYGPSQTAKQNLDLTNVLPPNAGTPIITGPVEWLNEIVGYIDIAMLGGGRIQSTWKRIIYIGRKQVKFETGYVVITTNGLFYIQWAKGESQYNVRSSFSYNDMQRIELHRYGIGRRLTVRTRTAKDTFQFIGSSGNVDTRKVGEAFLKLREIVGDSKAIEQDWYHAAGEYEVTIPFDTLKLETENWVITY